LARTVLYVHSSAGRYGADRQLLAMASGLDPSRYRARVVLAQAATDKILWEDDHFLFKRQYDVPETSIAFVDQEIIAIDEVATDFAKTVVTSLLEGF